jgi:hypothetical protein
MKTLPVLPPGDFKEPTIARLRSGKDSFNDFSNETSLKIDIVGDFRGLAAKASWVEKRLRTASETTIQIKCE